MSVGHHISDSYGWHSKSRPPPCQLCCDQAGMAEQNSASIVCLSDVVHIKPKASETYSHAEHCKQIVQGASNTLHTCHGFRAVSHTTHSPTLQHIRYCGSGALDRALQAGLSIDCGLLKLH